MPPKSSQKMEKAIASIHEKLNKMLHRMDDYQQFQFGLIAAINDLADKVAALGPPTTPPHQPPSPPPSFTGFPSIKTPKLTLPPNITGTKPPFTVPLPSLKPNLDTANSFAADAKTCDTDSSTISFDPPLFLIVPSIISFEPQPPSASVSIPRPPPLPKPPDHCPSTPEFAVPARSEFASTLVPGSRTPRYPGEIPSEPPKPPDPHFIAMLPPPYQQPSPSFTIETLGTTTMATHKPPTPTLPLHFHPTTLDFHRQLEAPSEPSKIISFFTPNSPPRPSLVHGAASQERDTHHIPASSLKDPLVQFPPSDLKDSCYVKSQPSATNTIRVSRLPPITTRHVFKSKRAIPSISRCGERQLYPTHVNSNRPLNRGHAMTIVGKMLDVGPLANEIPWIAFTDVSPLHMKFSSSDHMSIGRIFYGNSMFLVTKVISYSKELGLVYLPGWDSVSGFYFRGPLPKDNVQGNMVVYDQRVTGKLEKSRVVTTFCAFCNSSRVHFQQWDPGGVFPCSMG